MFYKIFLFSIMELSYVVSVSTLIIINIIIILLKSYVFKLSHIAYFLAGILLIINVILYIQYSDFAGKYKVMTILFMIVSITLVVLYFVFIQPIIKNDEKKEELIKKIQKEN